MRDRTEQLLEQLVHCDFRTEVDVDKARSLIRRAFIKHEKEIKKETAKKVEPSFFFDGDFRKDPKTDFFCVVCQKDLKSAKGYIMLGTGDICEARHPGALRGDELKVPVGSECIKKIPKEYIISPLLESLIREGVN